MKKKTGGGPSNLATNEIRYTATKFLCQLIAIGILLFIITSFLSKLPMIGLSRYEIEVNQNKKIMIEMTEAKEKEWNEALSTKKILKIEKFSEEERGKIIEKYIVELEDDYLAIGKLITPIHVVSNDFEVVSFQSGLLDDSVYPRRAYRSYSGWSEIGASAIASLLFPGSKPPAVLREIESNRLYLCPGCTTWTNYFYYLFFPSQMVPISLSPFFPSTAVSFWYPDIEYWYFLARPTKSFPVAVSIFNQLNTILLFLNLNN